MGHRASGDRLAQVQIQGLRVLIETQGGLPERARTAIRAGIPRVDERIARARLLRILGGIDRLIVQVDFEFVEQGKLGIPQVAQSEAQPFGLVETQGA